ncbi:amino acid permease [Aspergillus affinis]|uniref:amino acid permease n=1 Tax=Aspergillus affinis TaxID=1070780 RepID=UPI0022FE5B01|nr:amino acid permease [Aspergillus affinis]KAI9037550.1 amino acid permease [Aspergillus affinis]
MEQHELTSHVGKHTQSSIDETPPGGGENQTPTTDASHRLFNFTQIFFFSLTFMSSWENQALNLNAVLTNGGPEALAWGVVVVIFGAMA